MFFISRKLPIEQKKGLYCVWVRQTERPGAPLVAVWIDPNMSCFETGSGAKESAAAGETSLSLEESREGTEVPPPVMIASKRMPRWAAAFRGLAAVLLWMLVAFVAQG